MEIKKVSMKDGLLCINYEDEGTVFVIKSTEDPKPSLTNAMADLLPILLRNFEIKTVDTVGKDYSEGNFDQEAYRDAAKAERLNVMKHFRAIGLSHYFTEKDGDKYKILGMYSGSQVKCPIVTSAMSAPPAGDAHWKNGTDPAAFPALLTPSDVKAIEKFLDEVKGFIAGAREQQELFNSEAEEGFQEGETV